MKEESLYQKRSRFPETDPKLDRLSALPDDLLHYILAKLPDSKHRVRTALLSRRWRHLPRSHYEIDLHFQHVVRRLQDSDLLAATTARSRLNRHLHLSQRAIDLHFRYNGERPSDADADAYYRALDSALSMASPEFLHRLSIDVRLPGYARPQDLSAADRFLSTAQRLAVRDLSLFVKHAPSLPVPIPVSIFGCSSFERLWIKRGLFPAPPPGFAGFPALRSLCLVNHTIQREVLEAVFRGSPQLENFEMDRLRGVGIVEISQEKTPKLSHFAASKFFLESVDVRIFAPKIRTLHFEGDLTMFVVKTPPCLMNVVVREEKKTTNLARNKDRVLNQKTWMKIVLGISSVQTLTVNQWFFKFVLPNTSPNATPMFEKLKTFTCEIDWVTCDVLRSLFSCLAQCPLLEDLSLKLNKEVSRWGNQLVKNGLELHPTDLQVAEKDSIDLLESIRKMGNAPNNLKVVQIEKFLGTETEMLMMKFLFGIAHNLGKVCIKDDYHRETEAIRECLAPILSANGTDDVLHKIFAVRGARRSH